MEIIANLSKTLSEKYGAMPKSIFGELESRTRFVQYPDWTTRMKRFLYMSNN